MTPHGRIRTDVTGDERRLPWQPWEFPQLSPAARYALAVVVTALAAVARLAFDPLWGMSWSFILFFPAAMLSAWLGGFGPGVVSTILGALLADYLWIPPRFALVPKEPGHLAAVAVFIGSGVAISAIAHAARRAVVAVSRVQERRHERFRLALDAAPAAMVIVDQRGRIALVNALTETLLGYSRDELMGRPVELLVPERFRGRHAVYLREFFREPARRPMGAGRDLYAQRKDGVEVPVEIGLNPLETPEGMFVVAAITDISERKQAEQAEMAAKREAERANRAKDQFLAVVSHELRTPLSAIVGWAHMLRGESLNESQRRRGAEVIYASARRQAQLIEELLDVSRVLSGKLDLRFARIDLLEAARAALDVARPDADAKRIALTLEADLSLDPCEADPDRLQQILGNLLSNAIKFTPEGGAIQVGLRAAGAFTELSVTDTGPGIPEDFLPHIFEPFRQVDSSTTRRHGGLGLGLSIVRHLSEAHGGTVSAHSEGEGRGASFTVRLPCAPLPAPPTPAESPTVKRKTPVPAPGERPLRGIRVLVVDDDVAGREMVAATLSRHGAEVLTAGSAPEALDLLRREPVQVLLADLAMPGEDGYSLIRKVRALEEPVRSVPAAALTALVRAEDQERARLAGFDIHVPKPVDPDALVNVVSLLTRVRRRSDE